ncbi:MAG TPA: DUF2029 domain-containing protein [Chloroflexi bacterium]|nr:DUF2029 domain-containing protein [Chloroflexota bacterium]
MKRSRWVRVLLCGALVVVFVLQCWLMVRYAPRFISGYDFYPRWAGARALWVEGRNPYSDEVTRQIQLGFLGHLVEPGRDQIRFAYPLTIALLMAPLALLPYELALAVWTTGLFYLCLVSAWLAMRLVRWQPPLWLGLVTVVWSALFYPNLRSILVGQPGLLVLLTLLLALLALREGWDVGAGFCLALSTVKPQMALLPLLWLLWWGGWQRRRRFLFAFGGTLAGLLVVSCVALPTWPVDFVRQVLDYPSYMHPASVVDWVARAAWPGLGRAGELLPTLGLIGWLGWLWWQARRAATDSPIWLWTTGVTLTVANLMLPITAATFYTTLLMPLIYLFYRMEGWEVRWSGTAVLGCQVALLVGLSAVFVATIGGALPYEADLIPLPVLLLGALLPLRPGPTFQ